MGGGGTGWVFPIKSLEMDWATLSVGTRHSCALKVDGRIFCWGDGSNYQLGNNAVANGFTQVNGTWTSVRSTPACILHGRSQR